MEIGKSIIAVASWLVPADERAEWRREWLAELEATRGHRSPVAFALGAPRHALWLRLQPWQPSSVAADARFGVRQMRARPALALTAVLTLAIGAGATTAIFSVVYGVLLKPLPYRDPSRLVQFWETNPNFKWTEAEIAPGNLLSWRERSTSYESIAFYYGSATRDGSFSSLTMGGDEPLRVQGFQVSTNFFDVLGVHAAMGRTFLESEQVVGQNRVAVLSDRFWRNTLGAEPRVIDRALTLNGRPVKVIGVMRADFRFDVTQPDLWMPLTLNLADLREVRRPHYLRAIGRLKPGVTIAQARGELTSIATDLERQYPVTNTVMGAGLGPLDDWFVGRSRQPLLLFLAAVALVLLIACANVAHLMFARSLERAAEMSLRAALGASRTRLVRQLLIESLVVAAAGSVLGVGIAAMGIRLVVRFAPVDIPRLTDAAIDPAVMAFSLALLAFTAVLIGLAPALWGARARLTDAIGSGGRLAGGRAPMLRRTLVAAEVGLAVVLVIGATLATRSFTALVAVDPGLPIDQQVTGRVSLPALGYAEAGKPSAFFEDVGARLRARPGITAAGAVAELPLEGASWSSQFYIDGRPEFRGNELRHMAVTSGYLEALGVRLMAGRTIAADDRKGAPPAVVANEAFVRMYFPNEDPIGRRITWDLPGPNVQPRVIVGVVADTPQDAVGQPATPEVYYSMLQEERSEMAVMVRSNVPADRALAEIRSIVREIDPKIAVFDAGPMSARVTRALAKPRVAAWLVGGFATVALVLAGLGIYGVTAWAVAARRREFGIRIACGATVQSVFGLVFRQDLLLVAAGLGAGVALAALAARSVASLLFSVNAGDPISYVTGIVLLFAAGAVACAIPARRASRVDPVTSLRQ